MGRKLWRNLHEADRRGRTAGDADFFATNGNVGNCCGKFCPQIFQESVRVSLSTGFGFFAALAGSVASIPFARPAASAMFPANQGPR